jgi:hypothetical protein
MKDEIDRVQSQVREGADRGCNADISLGGELL